MFLGWKNQYCENDYTTEFNLQIQCDPYQITNGIFHITRTTKKSQFIWKHRRPKIAKAVLIKNNGTGEINLPDFILQSYSHQHRMILAQKQKYKPMEQDRKPRNKPMHLWVTYL